MAASSSSSSSVVLVKPEDLLEDTANSATVDRRKRWPEAGRTKSTFVVNQPLHSTQYRIPNQYTLVDANDWVACDATPEAYNMVCVYAAAFEAGMRLPFHDLHAAVLRHYGLAPSQLMPNAWRYLNAFVLLCERAGVQPTLPVFHFFFLLYAEKGAMGRFHFRPHRYHSLPGSGISSHGRLFTGKMPRSSPWKEGFFFVHLPSTMSWPCSLKWGTPSMASIEKDPWSVLTNETSDAVHKLVGLAGGTGIDIIEFLSKHDPPAGHLKIPAAVTPQHVAVKREATAAAVSVRTEETRKRKSPEPITSLTPFALQIGAICHDDRLTESPPAPAVAGVGHGYGEPSVTGDERSCSRMLLYYAQEVTAELDAKEQEVQALNEEVQKHVANAVLLEEQLAGANAKHATAVGDNAKLVDELQKANDKATLYAEELQKAKAEVRHIKTMHTCEQMESEREKNRLVREAYDKGVWDTKKLAVDMLQDGDTDLSKFTQEIDSLFVGSSPPPGPGLAPQAPMDD